MHVALSKPNVARAVTDIIGENIPEVKFDIYYMGLFKNNNTFYDYRYTILVICTNNSFEFLVTVGVSRFSQQQTLFSGLVWNPECKKSPIKKTEAQDK